MKYYPNEIFAKTEPKKSLEEHIQDCIKWFFNVIQWYQSYIEKIVGIYEIPKKILIQRLFLTVALHDIGKSTDEFQDKIRGININSLESHSLASVPFIYFLIKDKPILKFGDTPYFPEVFSIVSHHTKLKKDLFSNYNNVKNSYVSDEYYINFFDLINAEARKNNIDDWENIIFDSKMIYSNPYKIFQYNVLLNLEDDNIKYEKSNIIRDIFVLFKSVLHYCDWLASSNITTYQYSASENNASITAKMKIKVPQFVSWEPFQLHAAKLTSKNIFIQIPTGQGKTEASILWATQNNINQKIIFLLPTMVTTTKMWERMCHFFGGIDKVGLSHSTAKYILREKESEMEPETLRSHYLYNRTFFKPVTVATLDQLIYSFFNWGYWVLTGAASFNAKIIIDEVHIYDAYTFGLLLKVIEYIAPYNTQFAVMSASLPEILKQELEKVLPNYELIKEEKFDNIQRHKIEVRDCLIEQCTCDIICDFEAKKNVLVVCNTIAKAREIFDLLDEKIPIENRMLYHSQFILQDKKNKEDLLENLKSRESGFVAVCTQIVEVSLDIDFDVLYTENAPIDAIIQRLGRVNRKGEIQKRISNMQFAKVIITHESEKSRKYVYKTLSNVLSLTYSNLSNIATKQKGNITEKDLKKLVDIIYTKENLGDEYFNELNEAKNLIPTILRDYLKNIYTLNIDEAKLHRISSRKSDYLTVEAVLLKHYQQYNFDECIERNDYDFLRKYIIKVPLHIAKKFSCKKLNDSDIYLLDLKYDSCHGISLEPEELNFI